MLTVATIFIFFHSATIGFTVLFTAVFVRFWDHKNNYVLDSRYHSNVAALSPECSLSFRININKYTNDTKTNVKVEINKSNSTLQFNMCACIEKNHTYESEQSDMKTVISDINSSCSSYTKEYSSKAETNFNNLKQEIAKNYSTLQINFNKYSLNFQRFENDTLLRFDKVKEWQENKDNQGRQN